jgi:protein-L-isoaspartate O-methyltransferase
MALDLHTVTSGRRAGMVDRLTTDGVLTDSLLRDALLRVRVSGPGADPIDWRLRDGSHPDDRQEWLDLIHSDESILLQRDGEPLDTLPRGPVTGGHMTSMSTYTPATVEALQAMELGPGQRYLELGPGPVVSLALTAAITGPGLATGVERDGHMTAFAQRNLDRLGVGAAVIEGDALEGHEVRAPYDRIALALPPADRLARDGQLPVDGVGVYLVRPRRRQLRQHLWQHRIVDRGDGEDGELPDVLHNEHHIAGGPGPRCATAPPV